MKVQLVFLDGNHFVLNPTYQQLADNAYDTRNIPIINTSRTITSTIEQLKYDLKLHNNNSYQESSRELNGERIIHNMINDIDNDLQIDIDLQIAVRRSIEDCNIRNSSSSSSAAKSSANNEISSTENIGKADNFNMMSKSLIITDLNYFADYSSNLLANGGISKTPSITNARISKHNNLNSVDVSKKSKNSQNQAKVKSSQNQAKVIFVARGTPKTGTISNTKCSLLTNFQYHTSYRSIRGERFEDVDYRIIYWWNL